MAITILPPTVEDDAYYSSEEETFDSDEDVDMGDAPPPAKRPKLSSISILTPGELVTDDPQWMRYVNLNLSTENPAKTVLQRPRHIHSQPSYVHKYHRHRRRHSRQNQQTPFRLPPARALHARNRRPGRRTHRRSPGEAVESGRRSAATRAITALRDQLAWRNSTQTYDDR